jgi:hypothetical protein
MGLHIDPDKVRMENSKKQGSDIKRKNGCIVNSGSMHRTSMDMMGLHVCVECIHGATRQTGH